MHTTTNTHPGELPRELAHRRSGDINVRLMWDPAGGDVTVEVLDDAEGRAFVVPVGERPAMDVFLHPYAYAPAAIAA